MVRKTIMLLRVSYWGGAVVDVVTRESLRNRGARKD